MIAPDTRRPEQLNDIRAASPLSRHFPTFYLLWRCVGSLANWFWRHHHAFANATVLAALATVVLYDYWEHSIGAQRDAVAAIKRAGGSVFYDWEWSTGLPLPAATGPPWPKWVVKRLGPDFCGNVVAVRLRIRKADDALMIHVGRLTRLERLDIYGTAVTSAGLAQIDKLTSLETLKLPEFPRSDDDLSHLARLTRLKKLDLQGDQISNTGLAHLAEMRQMETLRLMFTKITTLEPIRGLTRLKELNLTGSPIEDDGLKPLEEFTSLQRLSLARTRITDAGIPHVSALADLTQLDLSRTKVGDAGARILFNLPGIMYLYLRDTRLTDAGLAERADRLNRSPCRTLEISGPKITRAGIAELRKRLPRTLVLDRDLNTQPAPSRAASTPPPTTDEELPR